MSEYLEEILHSALETNFPGFHFLDEDRDSLSTVPGENEPQPEDELLPYFVLQELKGLSTVARETIAEVDRRGLNEWSSGEKDDIHLFFAYVGQAQEHYLKRGVYRHIVREEVDTEEMREWFFDLNASTCRKLLYKADVIDSGLKGDLKTVRNERNESVHDISRWLFADFEPDKLEAQMDRAERSLVRLIEITEGIELEQK